MNKKVVITGGNGDIAIAIKELLLLQDFQVFAPSRNELDVTNIKSASEYFAKHPADILINNAGYIKPHSIIENIIEDEIKTIDVNLSGAFICSGALLKLNKDAIIVNVGSSAGTNVKGYWSSYCASKAGLIMATKCWHKEGVKTICISPGRTKTKMREALFSNENPDELLKPKDFASVILRAIHEDFEWGLNLDINVQNVIEFMS